MDLSLSLLSSFSCLSLSLPLLLQPVEVLLQGIHLQKDNINQTISFIKEKLHHLETKPFIKGQLNNNNNNNNNNNV